MNKLAKNIVLKANKKNIKSRQDLIKIEKEEAKKLGANIPSKISLNKAYQKLIEKDEIDKNKNLERVFLRKKVRTISGVAPVAVFTKPYSCPGNCYFCPTQKEVPKSYLDNEPAVMRAIRNDYDPIKQVWNRIKALQLEGHPTDKIELIIMGGSFTNYPDDYKKSFVKRVFWAANNYQKKKLDDLDDYDDEISLDKLQKINQQAKNRLIGISVETRPDLVNKKELKLWRRLGVTRVEIGVQILDDKILAKVNREHGVEEVVKATKLLKEAGFKLIYHLMPGLPGANIKKDKQSFEKVFTNKRFKPDQIKIYPCVVTKGAKIYDWYKQGKYQPYSEKQLKQYLIELKKQVPYWVRIIRVIRDIPSRSIVGGNKRNNLRQIIGQIMEKKGIKCHCIRCREVKGEKIKKPQLFVNKYQASGGKEIFFSYEDKKREKLYGLLRLRIPAKPLLKVLKGSAIIRELHIYGSSVKISKKDKKATQHKGLGKKLMEEAEKYVKKETDLDKIAIISGVGVRGYYKKLGYRLNKTYMVKDLIV